METGGMPPDAIELKLRYHNLNVTGGFAILESINASALADYSLDWTGQVKMEITAIMDDDTSSSVLYNNLVNGGLHIEL